MTLSTMVVENFIQTFFRSPYPMSGGMKNTQVSSGQFLFLFITFLILILIKAFIVYLGYNYMAPRIMYSLSIDNKMTFEEIQSRFHPITFVESVIFVILMNTLFSS
jgi:hypothetical protein